MIYINYRDNIFVEPGFKNFKIFIKMVDFSFGWLDHLQITVWLIVHRLPPSHGD